MTRNIVYLPILILFGACWLSACGGQASPAISIEGPWGRTSPKMAMAGVFYMTIHNNGSQADKLIGAQSKACGSVELHESVMDANNVMGMRPVAGGSIDIAAGGSVELKAGGLHLMCIDKLADFTAGAKLPLTLKFEKSGDISMEVDIKDQ